MSAVALHYIYDPFCGWCYAAAPLLAEACRVDGLMVTLHGGGMLAGDNRRPVTAEWRAYVMRHDQHIARLTHQRFGDAYFHGLLLDEAAVLDSEPPTTAILAATELGRGPQMLQAIQSAHFVEGRRVAEPAVLRELAQTLGLTVAEYDAAFERWAGEPTRTHFAQSRALLAEVGGQGFPTALLVPARGPATLLQLGPFLGRADAWRTYITGLAERAA